MFDKIFGEDIINTIAYINDEDDMLSSLEDEIDISDSELYTSLVNEIEK